VKLALVSPFALILALGGCSDEFSGGEGQGGTGATGGKSGSGGRGGAPAAGGSDAGPAGPCPASQPTVGDPCGEVGRVCTFGSDPAPRCRSQVECSADSRWTLTRQAHCSNLEQCGAGITTGTECFTRKECTRDLYCACTCQPGCSKMTWKCPVPGAPCPSVLPNAGTGCSQEGVTCAYGLCNDEIKNAATAQCVGGTWLWIDFCNP
jgi:hypothetical protein